MSDNSLIVPIVIPTGSLHFAAIKPNGVIQDVVNVLTQLEEVVSEVLGGLKADGWAVQKIRKENNGRQWEEEDLEALGDAILDPRLAASPLLNNPSDSATPERHFSAFPLTSHLHTPTLRLVSLHPLLSVTLSFLRVPEIHDGFSWKSFIARSTTVREVIDSVSDELGLTKALPVPGGGVLDYVLEEVWRDGKAEESFKIPFTSVLSEILEKPQVPNRFSRSAFRVFRFCVPDEWYRRSKSQSFSTESLTPTEETIKRLADLEEQESSDEEDGTAKQKGILNPPSTPGSPSKSVSGDPKPSSQNRLSSLFESWLAPSSHQVNSTSRDRMSVSEPTLLDQTAIDSRRSMLSDSVSDEDDDLVDFNQMLDELGLKGAQRDKMHQLPLDRKKYLLRQSRHFGSVSKATSPNISSPASRASTYSTASGGAVSRIVPQHTGDSLMKRLPVLSWASSSSGSTSEKTSYEAQTSFDSSVQITNGKRQSTVQIVEDLPQLQPQTTGGLWSSWWTSSGGDKAGDKVQKESPKWYVDGIRNGKITDMKLVKHLISLRVHVSTANIAWIEEFVRQEQGIEALGSILATLVSKGGKRKMLTEVENTILFELVKCLRVLLNTEPGFHEVLRSPTMITHIAYSLHGSSLKLRSLASTVLAAICIISMTEGHKVVISAFSDYRVEYSESFRFEELIGSLRLSENIDNEETLGEEEGIWEARSAVMSLINALTTCPNSLEDRILLRDEFTRRGLNEVMVTLRYIKPPESLLTQLDVYTEEKFEDEADMRERVNSFAGNDLLSPDSGGIFEDLIQLAKQQGDLYPTIIHIIKQYSSILQMDVDLEYKQDLFGILERFVQQASKLEDIEDGWPAFLKEFNTSVEHITGHVERSSSDRNAIIEDELESLRAKVDELSDERTRIQGELNQQVAEINTLRSFTSNVPLPGKSGKDSSPNFNGLVQRLVQKEKQTVQLQAELDRYKAQNPSEVREADERAKRDRDRAKWNALMEEIAKLKTKITELEASAGIKEKEVLYLKRALESVYSRYPLREENKDSEVDAQTIATRAIESLTRKDDEIASLQSQVTELTAQLAAKPKFSTEEDFKSKVAPPPPPPTKPKLIISSQPAEDLIHAHTISPSPPPPPPPPPSTAPPSFHLIPPTEVLTPPSPPPPPPSTLVLSNAMNGSGPPPPPPPPPPALSSSSGMPIPTPPPPPGPPPPPVPPPPQSNLKIGSPKIIRPTKRLKPFFWNKLAANTVQSTIWNETSSSVAFDLEDLEDTFSLDNSASKTNELTVSVTKKHNVTTLLDITRANNIAIMLSRIKLDLPDIRRALLDIDDVKLSMDDLRSISKQLPTSEEITRIKDFADVGKLAKSDQYFDQIMIIPRLSPRLDCMLYRRKLELEMEEIRPDMLTVRNACKDLRNSERFKAVLQAVLAVGNALNGTSFRGGARGFQLEALIKMKETKTAKGGAECPTLLHYLARVLLRTNPDLVNFIDEMRTVEAAARISAQTLFTSVNSLVGGLNQIEGEIKELSSSKLPAGDRFIFVMRPFIEEAEKNVDALKSMASALESEIRSLLAYYGEAIDTTEALKPEDFFGMILSFSTSLQKCALEVHALQEKLAASTPKTGLLVPQITATQPHPVLPPPPLPPSSQGRPAGGQLSVGRGDLDQAIRSMRVGTRRARPNRPADKIFLDGRRSRAFD